MRMDSTSQTGRADVRTGPPTFVSLVYEAEYPLLLLQARSMSRFLPEHLVAELLVIDNSARAMPASVREKLLSSYGALAPRVRILRPTEISTVPAATGWRSQQVLKLAVAELVRTDRYVVLDAKNHLVAPAEASYFFASDGRPRLRAYSFASHPLRRDLERVLDYLGLDPAAHVEHFPATVTPFPFDTALVRAMMSDIERRAGRSFAREFVRADLTEFFLYTGWILSSGTPIGTVYELHEDPNPTVWPRGAHTAGVRAAVDAAASGRSPFFTVHRRAFPLLDAAARGQLADFWSDRGLFDSADDAAVFLRRYGRQVARSSRAQRVRELPLKVLSLPRKVRERLLRRRTASPARQG